MADLTCPTCKTTWHQAGNRTGHCSQCHRTFNGITAFDAHQRIINGECICMDPALIMRRTKGVYELRFKSVIDRAGAAIWRDAKDLPAGTFGARR